jgi:hypothetical protein
MAVSRERSKTKSILETLKKDPLYHIETVQGVKTLHPFQKRVIQTVWENERTAVYACHDVGKTFTVAKIVLAFTSIFAGAKVITTAPTFNQVKRLLWSEIRAGFTKSVYPLGGEMLMTEWKIADDWFALGFTSRNEQTDGEGQGQASHFQGFHAPAMLVVFDEATGIMGGTWKQVEGLLTSGFVRFVAIGNPTTKACEFFKCLSDPSYKKIHLNCFDSPNFTANGFYAVPDLEREYQRLKELSEEEQQNALGNYKVVDDHLLTVRWVMRLVLKYGLKHPLVVSKALGQFPEEDEYTLISLGIVQEAQFRKYSPNPRDRVSIGVDVARMGSDKTVITVIQGVQQVLRKEMVKRMAPAIAGEVIQIALAYPEAESIRIVVDTTGIGAGVTDILIESVIQRTLSERTEVREMHFGWGADALERNSNRGDELKKKYANMKAQIFVLLQEDLEKDLCLLEEEIYAEELPTIQYTYDSKGRWVIESKDDYKLRTKRESPDTADSLALANFGRYDASGVGKFKESSNEKKISTIIQYSEGGVPQW